MNIEKDYIKSKILEALAKKVDILDEMQKQFESTKALEIHNTQLNDIYLCIEHRF
jgi:hypothetical protein